MTTSADSIVPNAALVACNTGVSSPKWLIQFTNDLSAGIKLKFVSYNNRLDVGPVKRNHSVYITLFDDSELNGYFKVSGNTGRDFSHSCNKYVTAQFDEHNVTAGLSNLVVVVRDQNNESSTSDVTYGSINYFGSNSNNRYIAYCDSYVNKVQPPIVPPCSGPALAWNNKNGTRLKFVIHRFPEECETIGDGCSDTMQCCQMDQGSPANPNADRIHCVDNQCRYCAFNGEPCDPQNGDQGITCCSGICGNRDGAMQCKPFLDVGDECTASSQCGSADMGLLCHNGTCQDCIADNSYEGPLECQCLSRSTECDVEGTKKCCDDMDCIFSRSTGTYICGDKLGVVIPLYGWILIVTSGLLLLLLLFFVVRLSSSGSQALRKKREEAGLEPVLKRKKPTKNQLFETKHDTTPLEENITSILPK